MRIVYVIYQPGQGGMEKNTYLLAKHALANGYQVDFIFGTEGPLVDRVRALGCRIHFVKMRAPFDLIAVVKLIRVLKGLKPDVVHTHFMRENFLTIDASMFVKIPAIFSTVHRLEKKTIPQALINRLYSRGLTKFIAVSPLAKDYLLEEGIRENKIVTILNGAESPKVDIKKVRANLGLSDKQKLLTYVGRFTAEKGHSSLVNAFARVCKQIPEAILLLAGEGELKSEIEDLVDKLDLSKRVIFTDVVNEKGDIAHEYVAAGDVYVQPSIIENLPTSVVEALLYGVPIIASDCVAHKYLLQNGEFGTLYENQSVEMLSKSILAVAKSNDILLKAKKGQAYARKHLTAERMWSDTKNLYQKYAKDKNRE